MLIKISIRSFFNYYQINNNVSNNDVNYIVLLNINLLLVFVLLQNNNLIFCFNLLIY